MPIPFWMPPVPMWNLKPVVEYRERFERRLNKDFDSPNEDNRSDLFTRVRAGVEFKYGKQVSGKVVYQYAHDLYWTGTANASKENSDILAAYVDVRAGSGKLRAGRQQFGKGCERLFTEGNWGNGGRSWNMLRWTVGPWDAWAGQAAVGSCKEAVIGGLSFKSNLGETMFAYKHDERGSSKDDIYTLDHRWTKSMDRWSFDAEVAGQVGRAGASRMEAWAGSARAGYQLSSKASAYAEANAASGGNRGGTVHTFDQLYAGNHGRYGIVDAQGWRNMKGLSFGLNFKPNAKSWMTLEYSRFGLFAADDAWYGDNGKINKGNGFNFHDPAGGSGTDVGHELDFSGGFTLDSHTYVEGGIGVFRPSTFIKNFNVVGSDQVWMYLQLRIRF